MFYPFLSICRAGKAAGAIVLMVLIQATFAAVPIGFGLLFARTLPSWLSVILGALAGLLWIYYFRRPARRVVEWAQKLGREALS